MIDKLGSDRMLMLRLTLSSGDSHPTVVANNPPDVVGKRSAKNERQRGEDVLEKRNAQHESQSEEDVWEKLSTILKTVGGTDDHSDETCRTGSLLYRPISTVIEREDGWLESAPIDVIKSMQTFANSMHMIKNVRAHSGEGRDNKTLPQMQMDKAIGSLRKLFEDIP